MINIDDDGIKELWLLLETLNDIFHDPDKFCDSNVILNFQKDFYPIIHKMYYDTLWNSLTRKQKSEFTGDEFVD